MNENRGSAGCQSVANLQAELEALRDDYEESVGVEMLFREAFETLDAQVRDAQIQTWILATLLNVVLAALRLKPGSVEGAGERVVACARLLAKWRNLPDVCIHELPLHVRVAAQEHAAAQGIDFASCYEKVRG